MNEFESKFIEKLYKEMAGMLWRYALKELRNDDLANEAVQRTFLDACEKVGAVMKHNNPRAWIVAALKLTISKMSAEIVKRSMLEEKTPKEFDTTYTDEVSTDVLYSDIKDTDDYKFLKKYADSGLPIRDFAQTQGLSAEACKKRLQRARLRLQKIFKICLNEFRGSGMKR